MGRAVAGSVANVTSCTIPWVKRAEEGAAIRQVGGSVVRLEKGARVKLVPQKGRCCNKRKRQKKKRKNQSGGSFWDDISQIPRVWKESGAAEVRWNPYAKGTKKK
ncbi:Hypothetical predicted protein [Paramuricea clavata]|uniref:Uncharacterized protein n=1 Tax=Paramuricea clavata TaxID=317549 RepID=A0A6S7FWI3_PARCT|nr:Hypothetical predicted protein [Paramuricea clavata]